MGPSKIGVTSVCTRIKFALENLNYAAQVIAPRSLRDVEKFEDNYYCQQFADSDVILFDNHHYTTSAIRTGRREIGFYDADAIKPDFSFLLVANLDDYVTLAGLRKSHEGQRNARAILNKYQTCSPDFFGSQGLQTLKVDCDMGRLIAAGNIKQFILKELNRGK